MSNHQQPLLRVSDLHVQFKVKPEGGWIWQKPDILSAVNGVSFELNAGETLGVVGESGCGKSTLARAIIGLVKAHSGNIVWQGEELTGLSVKKMRLKRKDIQMIFQDPLASLNPRMTIGEIIAEPLRTYHPKMPRQEVRDRVKAMMLKVGLLPNLINRYPHEFSGGQCQRIGIARALIMEPEFVVADEPISALDVSIRAQVLNLLNQLKASRGLTYLFIAHDLSVVRFISDRIAVIYKGRIVELAEAEELFHHPLHPYTKALLSAVPIPDPEIEKKKKLLIYDPTLHDYTISKPQWVEITEGHFVYGNEPELEKYRAEIEAINAAERA